MHPRRQIPRRGRSLATLLTLGGLAAGTLALAAPSQAATTTPVMAAARVPAVNLAGWYRSTGKTSKATVSIDALAAAYVEEGADEGVAGDLAFAQAMVETGYLGFSTRMPPGNNNFAGLGAVDGGSGSAAFPDARTGVRAQIQHLRAYGDPTVTVATLHHPLVDGRFTLVSPKGKAPTWEQFGNGIWASDPSYAATVLGVYAKIAAWSAAHPVTTTTTTTTPPSRFAPYGSADAIVRQGFRDLLYRDPTSSELAAGTALVHDEKVSPAAYYSALLAGEGRQVLDPVARLYLAALGRGPDRGGLSYWSGRRRGGDRLVRLAEVFLGSHEFASRYGTPTDAGYVALLYRNVLGRTADSAGTTYWVGRLRAGMSRATLLVQFSESGEFVGDVAGVVEVVEVYIGMLARSPQLLDLAWWDARRAESAPLSLLVERAWNDPGYAARVS